MNILHVIEIAAFALLSFGLYKFFRSRKYELTTCMAVIAILFFVLLLQFVLFPVSSEPAITFKGGAEIELAVGTAYDASTVKASRGREDLTDKLRVEGTVDSRTVGVYTLRYTLEYDGNIYYADRTVTVADMTKPEILLGEGNAFSAEDNYDGDLTDRVLVSSSQQEDGTFLLTYTVADSSGNQTTVTRTVETLDEVPPEITLNGNSVKVLLVGETYTDEGCTASDDTDGNISAKVVSDCGGEFKAEEAGTYRIHYTVTDSSNNIARAERVVKVINKVGYDAATWKTDKGNGVICLTFDDGPGRVNTPKNLETLKQYGVKATFFICNYSDSYKDLVQQEIDEGHTVALHTYSHEYSECYATEDSYLDGINKLHDKVLADTGYDARIIRFPGGSSNAVSKRYTPGLMGRLTKKMLDNGYLYFDWNADSTDAETKYMNDANAIFEHAISGIQEGRYNVLLMHDIDSKKATAEALSRIIQWGLDHGFVFEPITVDTPLVCHNATNV